MTQALSLKFRFFFSKQTKQKTNRRAKPQPRLFCEHLPTHDADELLHLEHPKKKNQHMQTPIPQTKSPCKQQELDKKKTLPLHSHLSLRMASSRSFSNAAHFALEFASFLKVSNQKVKILCKKKNLILSSAFRVATSTFGSFSLAISALASLLITLALRCIKFSVKSQTFFLAFQNLKPSASAKSRKALSLSACNLFMSSNCLRNRSASSSRALRSASAARCACNMSNLFGGHFFSHTTSISHFSLRSLASSASRSCKETDEKKQPRQFCVSPSQLCQHELFPPLPERDEHLLPLSCAPLLQPIVLYATIRRATLFPYLTFTFFLAPVLRAP
jgi:hypothetical protein